MPNRSGHCVMLFIETETDHMYRLMAAVEKNFQPVHQTFEFMWIHATSPLAAAMQLPFLRLVYCVWSSANVSRQKDGTVGCGV